MHTKYDCGDELIPKVRKKACCSNAWQGIMKVWWSFYNQLIWRLGDGRTAKFWTSHWFPRFHSLKDFALVDLDDNMLEDTMDSFVSEEGDWNWNALSMVLLDDILELFHMMKTSNIMLGNDTIDWMLDT